MSDTARHDRNAPPTTATRAARETEWLKPLAALSLAWLVFETLSGLAIWLLPFSVPNQWTVIFHTAIGLLFLLPAVWYLVRHLVVYWNHQLTSVKVMGYLASASTLAALVSGLVLTWQAVFARRIGYGWDVTHVISTFALIAFTAPHVVVILLRDLRLRLDAGSAGLLAAQRRAMARTVTMTIAIALPIAAACVLYPGERMNDEFPSDYSYIYGEDRPFAPSLATTDSGQAFDSRSLAGSESCGTTGCHEQIVAEWRVSAHAWSARDAAFQAIQTEMAKQNGPESTRYCGGCHDPISLFSGTKNIFAENLTTLAGYQEGVSCLSCHSVRKTDLAGNANYIMARPARYLFELREGPVALFARDFLIRAYPRQHLADLSKRLFKTPEYCAACHKQFIDKEVNNVGWVQLQNQFDNWRMSRWNHPGDPTKTIECRECHMPLLASEDPAAGDPLDYNRSPEDGRHRSHRFLGANQFMPAVLELPGAQEQIELTGRWLRGEIEIPEISDKWQSGPAVAVQLVAPPEVRAGEPVELKAVITSNKVGHDFPTGPLDIIQAWVEVTVTDESGGIVFDSGHVNERHFIEPGAFMFKAEPVDQYGNLIDRHNLWEMVGVRYRRSLFPGFSDTAEFSFRCPGSADAVSQPPVAGSDFRFEAPPATDGALKVTARVMYRKVDQYLLNFMFGENSGLTAPITEMARSEAEIRVANSTGSGRASARAAQQVSPAPPAVSANPGGSLPVTSDATTARDHAHAGPAAQPAGAASAAGLIE